MLFAAAFSFANAQLWLEENFNYPDGALEQADNSEVVLHKWMPSMKPADALGTSPQVVSRNLTYTGYPASAQGKSVVLDATVGAGSESQRISVYYLDTIGHRDTVSMYAAFLFKPLSAPNTSGRDFAVWEGSVTSSMVRGRLFLAKSGDKVKIGITKNSTSISNWSNDIAVGSTNLIVMKYEVIDGASNDVVKVFVNPTLNTAESANTPLVSADNATDMLVKAFGLRQRGIGAEISGLRIGTTWEEAIGMVADALLLENSIIGQDGFVNATTPNLWFTFNKSISLGSGDITLTEKGGQNTTLTPTISDKTVKFAVSLKENTDYTLTIPEGAFVNGDSKNAAITINFTTTDPNIYAIEEFNYTVGQEIEGNGGWTLTTATADQGGKSPLVAEEPLVYANYLSSAVGHSMLLDSAKQEISGDLKRNTVFPFTDSSVNTEDGNNTVYTAFLINLSEMNSTSGKEVFCYLKQGASDGANTTMRGRVMAKIENETVSFGIRKNSKTIEDWSTAIGKTETALLVVKYINKSTTSSGDNDEFYLYVNPDPTESEANNAALMLTAVGNDADGGADLRHICFRQMKLNATVSGIRIAKTWDSLFGLYTEDLLPEEPVTGVETIVNSTYSSAKKILHNGQLYILRDGNIYTISGQKIK